MRARADAPAALAPLAVSGSVEVAEDRLDLAVAVTNRGALAASPLTVTGRLDGRWDAVKLDTGVGAGETRRVLLRFPPPGPRLGMIVVALRLDYQQAAAAGAAPTALSQAAYLMVALGVPPPPGITLTLVPLGLETRGAIAAQLQSADGQAHRVRLRAVTPRGLNAEPAEVEVEVPASGTVSAGVPLLRAGAARGMRLGVLVAAETIDGAVQQAAVAETTVEILPDPVWLPRLRTPLFTIALMLAVLSGLAEWRRYRASRAVIPPAEPTEPPAP